MSGSSDLLCRRDDAVVLRAVAHGEAQAVGEGMAGGERPRDQAAREQALGGGISRYR